MKNLAFDKKLHLAFGAAFGLLAYLVAKDLGASQDGYMAAGVITTLVIAIGTEVYQKITKSGTFERADIFFTILGGFGSCLFYLLFTFTLNFLKTLI